MSQAKAKILEKFFLKSLEKIFLKILEKIFLKFSQFLRKFLRNWDLLGGFGDKIVKVSNDTFGNLSPKPSNKEQFSLFGKLGQQSL